MATTAANSFFCYPVWLGEPDTEFNDQALASEGVSALHELRRQGFLPAEEPEPHCEWEEVAV